MSTICRNNLSKIKICRNLFGKSFIKRYNKLMKKKLLMILSSMFSLAFVVCGTLFLSNTFAGGGGTTLGNSNAEETGNLAPKNPDIFWGEEGYDYANHTWSGTGSESDPYLISTAQDLACLSWRIYTNTNISSCNNKYFKQTADIDVSDYYWAPIGVYYNRENTSLGRAFCSVYDGGGFAVSGVFTPAGTENKNSYQGLFGYVTNSGAICNLRVTNSFVQGRDHVGGIVGSAKKFLIKNCINEAKVSSSNYAGGIAGWLQDSEVCYCINKGYIEINSSYAGGIAGNGYNDKISNCKNFGNISSLNAYIGGILGDARIIEINYCENHGNISSSRGYAGGICGSPNSDVLIRNCCNRGDVTGGYIIGGVVGVGGTIEHCFNSGNISATSTINDGDAGGISGYSSIITNCFNIGEVTSIGKYFGGIVGNGGGQTLMNCYYGGNCNLDKGVGGNGTDTCAKDENLIENIKTLAWFQDESKWSEIWDFEEIWEFREGENEGYPVLRENAGNLIWGDEGTNIDVVWEGEGTKDAPYLISTAEELAGLSWTIYNNQVNKVEDCFVSGSVKYFYKDKFFRQTANIDVSAYWWRPIGIYYNEYGFPAYRYFSGYYDGGGYVVSGIRTQSGITSGYSYQGLFGYIQPYSENVPNYIQNLGIVDSDIQGYQRVGGIAGQATFCFIRNCFNRASVVAKENYVGGIVGYGNKTIIDNCFNEGSISGIGQVGGIAGTSINNESKISNCFNIGNIIASKSRYYCGGIVGQSWERFEMKNCYNLGSVTGGYFSCGLIGQHANSGLIMSDCFNLGSVEGISSYVGGICTYNSSVHDKATVKNCYYGGNCMLDKGIVGGTDTCVKDESLIENARSLSWFQDESKWSKVWDFENTWKFVEGQNDGYPVLQMKEIEQVFWGEEGYNYANHSWRGTGTETDPYLISTPQDLACLSWRIYNDCVTKPSEKVVVNNRNYYYRKSYFKQTEDINVSEYWWTPIGVYYDRDNNSVQRSFSGNYDGGGYSVSGIQTPEAEGSQYRYYYQGLFGYAYGTSSEKVTIGNLGVVDSFIQGRESCAGILGMCIYTTIKNCYNTANVLCYGSSGGILGRSENVEVSDCYNAGDIQGGGYTGGIAANIKGKINNCYNIGKVNGTQYVGGVVGHLYFSDITDCYNTGEVTNTGIYCTGGVIADIDDAVTVQRCFNRGKVTGGVSVGGVIGATINSYSYTISDCRNYGDVESDPSYTNTHVGGIVGNTKMFTYINCISEGNVKSSKNVGGIAGYASKAKFINCSSRSNLESTSGAEFVGGFVGQAADSTITNCTYIGSGGLTEANIFYGTATGTNTLTSCYSKCGDVAYYTTGDFADFRIADNINDSLPFQASLYAISEFIAPSDIVSYLKLKDFILYVPQTSA